MSLGENINRLRREKLMSQTDLADALNVSRQSVSKWESDASTPELEKLLAISELFGVSLDELIKGEKSAVQPEAKQADKESYYCLVLTDSIFKPETMERLLCEDFGYDEGNAKKAITEAPVVIKRGLRYADAERIEREIREVAWLKIIHDEDAWNPVKVKEGRSSVPPPEAPSEKDSDGWDFWGLVVAVVVGILIAVGLLAIC